MVALENREVNYFVERGLLAENMIDSTYCRFLRNLDISIEKSDKDFTRFIKPDIGAISRILKEINDSYEHSPEEKGK